MKILIIDDDEQIREILRMWLEKSGFNVFEAHDGKQGVQIHEQSSVDMLICDLIMPGQEGIETITQFKTRFPDVCIVAISGGGQIGPDSYLHMASSLGAWKVYRKPLSIPLLIDDIKTWQQEKMARG
ncbi:MAG: response regulator [Desulfocapsaceae bacterium]|nr:response regulator [Desulfocapsaceae bacterium]